MPDYRAFSGARAILRFDDIEAGWATGVSGTENITLQRVDVLGNIDSYEIEAVGRTVTMTADFVRIIGESLQKMGIVPTGDTAQVINFPSLTAEVYDEVGDQMIYRVEGLKCESRNWRVDRQGLMTVNCTFQGRRMYDESGA